MIPTIKVNTCSHSHRLPLPLDTPQDYIHLHHKWIIQDIVLIISKNPITIKVGIIRVYFIKAM